MLSDLKCDLTECCACRWIDYSSAYKEQCVTCHSPLCDDCARIALKGVVRRGSTLQCESCYDEEHAEGEDKEEEKEKKETSPQPLDTKRDSLDELYDD
jgi:hypothetical protein